MNIIQSIFVIDAHTTGSPIRVVTGGIPNLKGKSISQKMDDMSSNYDYLRTCILQQPRGCLSLMCAVLTEPTVEGADFGLFYMDAGGYQPMCGAGTMATAKCIVESGMVKRTDPVTRVTFDTGPGLVSVDVKKNPDGSTTTTLNNAPSFLYMTDKNIVVPEIGDIKFDMVFGGNFFAVVDVKQLGFKITPETIPTMRGYMPKIVGAINKKFKVQHPVNPAINYLNEMLFVDDEADSDGSYLAQAIFGDAQVDISPCGTGTSGRLAQRYFKGILNKGEEYIQKQTFGGKFFGKVVEEVEFGGYNAILPQVSCSDVHITGFNHLVCEASDRLKWGFTTY